jgi:phenylpropionate dioxygenase-like ring-hydroxylating dioxygenase large terminal subunit
VKSNLRERDGDLINHWYILCLSQELPKDPARPLQRSLYDRPYVIFRGDNGQPIVLLDRCPHRGAQLSLGTCKSGHLHCPYHGWVFGHNGKVTQVPSDGDAHIPSANLQAEALPVVEQDGAIWVWVGDPAQRSERPEWRFPHFAEPGWNQYFMITDFPNEVTYLVENFMDVPHTVFVHDKWFRTRKAMNVPISLDVARCRVKVTYHQANDSIGFMGRILNPQAHPMLHTDEFIFPNLTRVDYSFGAQEFIINSQCSPLSTGQTRVYTWICYRLPWVGALLKPFFKFYTRQVITQDVEIMTNHGENLRLFPEWFAGEQYKNTAADELHIAIDRMRKAGAQNRNSIQDMKFSREREFWI